MRSLLTFSSNSTEKKGSENTDAQSRVFKQVLGLKQRIQKLESELQYLNAKCMNTKQKEKIDVKKQWRKDKIRDSITLLSVAKEMFTEFDKNSSGTLEGDEILKIADWILDVYAPDGFRIRKLDKIYASNELVDKCDKNHDGALDFAEFAEWVLQTMNFLKKLFEARSDEQKENEDYSSGDGNALNDSPVDQQLDGFDSDAQVFSKGLRSKQTNQKAADSGSVSHNRSKSEGDKLFNNPQYEYADAKKGDPTTKVNSKLKRASANKSNKISNYRDESDEKRDDADPDFVRVELPVKLLNSPNKVALLVPAGSEKTSNNPWRSESWAVLLNHGNRKFTKPARTGVQLFLRLCQARDKKNHILQEVDVQELFRIAGAPPNQQKESVKHFFDFFNASQTRRITMPMFVKRMPPDANETHLWAVLQEVKAVTRKTMYIE